MKKSILKIIVSSVIYLFLSLTATTALAFGHVEDVVGKASSINIDGETRALSKGGKVEVGETLVTGDDAELLIKTDDNSVVLLKANSKFLVETYSAKGNPQDAFVAKLIKGAVRAVTGFIGKNNPQRYSVKTPTATIGVRGTDYQLEILDNVSGVQSGTYVKVNSGEISVTNRGIYINVAQKQFALATASAPPQLIDDLPAGLFPASKLDEKIDSLVKANSSDAALRTQQDEQKRGAGSVASGETRIPNNCASDNPAQRTLDDFIKAYERGDIAYIQRHLDPSMIGYGTFLNSMMEDANAQKQIRFLIQNRNVQCGSDLAVINFRWEKRYLDLTTFAPRLQAGQASVLTYLKAGEWKLSGITGDNPFASSLNINANLTLSVTQASYSSFPQTCGPAPTSTLSGTASTSPLILGNTFSPSSCTQVATSPTCTIAGFPGTASGTVTCSGTPATAGIYTASGSVPFSSTGPSSSAASVTVVIPVSGNSGNGQTASGVFSCTATITYPTGAPVCTVAPSTASVGITLTNQNLAGTGSVQVEAVASNGDREVYVLNETSPPGTFKRAGINIAGGAVVQNNGVMSINGPTTINFKYVAPRTGSIASAVLRVTP